jgi:hypothetical protein
MNRRRRLAAGFLGAILLGGAAAPTAQAAEPPNVRQIRLTVAETAGIRRFGYPVTVVLDLPEPVRDVEHFRLLADGKPVTGQFRPHGDVRDGIHTVSIDFNASPAPLESREYVIEYGPGVERGPEPKDGLRVETTEDEFRVIHPGELIFAVPRDLLGLLRGVQGNKTDYLRPGSAGLWIRYKDDIHYRAGGRGPDDVATRARVVKEGPLAVALRFESTEALRGGRSVESAVEMEFPVTKSWVRVLWDVKDPNGYVAGLGVDLNLNAEGEPTLVDFGAGSYVYAALHKGQVAKLRAGAPAWETLLGSAADLRPYVVAPRNSQAKAEGWAHVMDRERCTAVAVQDFAGPCPEATITVQADGGLQVWKHFALGGQGSPPGVKRLTFWLHFVPMPVHVGAATSPQAMLSPLQVTVRPQP